MEAAELVKIAKSLGAKVELIKKSCQYQEIGHNVFETCQKREEFGINLGSAGGPAVVCNGHSLATGGSHKRHDPEFGEVNVIEYSKPKTCPYYLGKNKTIGWKIFLPNKG